MDSPNRLNPTAMTLTLKRQTPKNEFGQVLANTLQGAVKTGGAIVGALTGAPLVSAAVSSVSTVSNQLAATGGAVSARSAATGIVTLGSTTSATAGIGAGSAPGSVAGESGTYTNPDVQQMAQMSDYYLHLQNEMQQESREYNAVSNIIKVRHDSAKAAINNIR
jgi:hypothetical protein